MKERPILFNGPMVRAILDGSKTQTRRVVNPQPLWVADPCVPFKTSDADPKGVISCPYGKAGDGLWVRETFGIGRATDWTYYRSQWGDDGEEINGAPSKSFFDSWKPSIHMPRSRSRINLEITGVRIERLTNISEADAIAEGSEPVELSAAEWMGDRPICTKSIEPGLCNFLEHKTGYARLWESINGPGSWAANPWVWVIEFKRI